MGLRILWIFLDVVCDLILDHLVVEILCRLKECQFSSLSGPGSFSREAGAVLYRTEASS